ncbi:MAG: tetratricopeptide repeat protein [Acidimicrobiia bacterium]
MADDHSDQIALLREEIADLDVQVSAGDLDADTAATLRARYAAELTALEAATTETGATTSDTAPDTAANPQGRARPRISGRMLAGAAVMGAAIVAIGVFAVASLDDGTSGVAGVVSDALVEGGTTDLSDISNEEMETVVAANPEVIGMRLALARRYFEEGSFDLALDHYFEVLDREQHPEALANVGWMTYLSQRPDVALGYLEAALERQPDYLPAQWFISNVFVTLGRGDEAVPFLVLLANSDDVPVEIKEGAVALLTQIEGTP